MDLSGITRSHCSVPVSDEIVSRSKSNFISSFCFLPERKKRAVKTFYAFCRELDDGVDKATDKESALRSVQFWKDEIEKMGNGGHLTPLGEEIRETIHSFDLSIKNYTLLIEGVETDIIKNRYETFEELYQYCYRVASTVGIVCCEILGVRSPGALRYAEFTGVGVQLTNILRDVGEDAEMGRIYLPLEDLRRFSVTEKEILEGKAGKNLFDLMNFEAARAEAFFNMGRWILSPLEAVRLYFCHLLAGTYMAVLEELKRENFSLFQGKVKVTTLRKLQMGVKTAVTSVFGSLAV